MSDAMMFICGQIVYVPEVDYQEELEACLALDY